ncbi:ribosomal RNA-processing protein 15 [[Candida] jaroonii]|uniref:Ribosomal RNA-processing protein 15 n=1 Tax=[Candida] jaroonii TaxID=467808 RepID=A0ACA9YAA1_9ASCO|nr:ribosomal RNA-processing protein 15 [[Candida] jaroonii]
MGKVVKKQKVKNGVKNTKKDITTQVEIEREDEIKDNGEESEENSSENDSQSSDEDEMSQDSDVSGDADSEKEDEEDSEQEESEEEDDDFPMKQKKSKNREDGSESFATALNSIIGSKLKAHDRSAPIMVRNKKVLKKLESDKLEAKAKRAILSEKKQLYDKFRVKNLLAADTEDLNKIMENEKKLKKTAQRGVVKLFNAIISTQVKTTEALKTEKVGEVKKEELFNEMSKEKFLDLVQSAGK